MTSAKRLKIAIPKETAPFERRMAASPDTVKKYITLGLNVTIETGAGQHAAFTDDAFRAAGATIAPNTETLFKDASIILSVQPPDEPAIKLLPPGSLLIALLAPHENKSQLSALAKAKIESFSMDLIPRISRAQSMDALSSQSNLAGYKAVLDAANHYERAFPMMMTAAGMIAPAKIFIMGAGVAGLQAVATARRLGAIVSATDVRPAVKEQIASLGATFIAVEDEEFKKAETSGGYAKEMSKEYQAKQKALVEDHIAKQDIVITTALIPGRPAPRLITAAMARSMQPGSIIVDLAVESGGNCELSKPGEIIVENGVKIIGHRNVPARLATEASSLYARNLYNLLSIMINKETGGLAINYDDEIIKNIALTQNGKIIHPAFTTITPQEQSEKSSTAETKPAAKPKAKTAPKTKKSKEPAP